MRVIIILTLVVASVYMTSANPPGHHKFFNHHGKDKSVIAALREKLKEKFSHHPGGKENPPNDEVKELVKEHEQDIKIRAKFPVETEEDKKDLDEASVEALGFIKHEEGGNDIYFIRVIVGSEHIVHVKISVPHGKKSGSTLMHVLGDKKEGDKLDEKLFS